ncbi:RtcB family protein [Methylorubrum extorquens]|uniref:RtcB family protein n=1 Tax=Methylorubrum extorquens TaxID=408 RepID=UPI00209C9561|nr:RtcB family protein [Methylorubrum extorquens]MCP1540121.1 tRNA-splicing ligase RtcB [Methylorubrum extorquens]
MSEASFVYHDNPGGRPLKTWTRGVHVEESALQQLKNVGQLPFIHGHVAAMPDVHYGKGATIGSVIATDGAIVPAAIGVDIGCGMQAVKLNLLASEISDPKLRAYMRQSIEKAVPHGRTDNGGPNDRGAWHDIPDAVAQVWHPNGSLDSLGVRWGQLCVETNELRINNTVRHLGTLGSGNHFIEVQEGSDGYVWLMLHSGSRGPGAKIAGHWMKVAKELMKKWFIKLPDPDLAYLVEGTVEFRRYIDGMHWAQDFARANRNLMMNATIRALGFDPRPEGEMEKGDVLFRIDCHHNFTQRERHDGKHLWITRKGATSARRDEFGIIPGSMGTGSFIVKGLGNRDSFMSCSHGAGRAMSRTQAFKTITLESHAAAVEGIECRRDAEVLDESPAAYKDVNSVIAAQEGSLITVHERLRTLINVKG